MALQRTQSLTTTKIASGSAAGHIGMKGELTVSANTVDNTVDLRLHDGITAGGTLLKSYEVGNYLEKQEEARQSNTDDSASEAFSATGGTETEITVDGQAWKVHTFTNSGTLEVTGGGSKDIEYVIVGGGGAGGADYRAGGGGAGGYRSSVQGELSGGGSAAESLFTISGGNSYTVTVGDGGIGAVATRGTDGGPSSFDTIVALGGGSGGADYMKASIEDNTTSVLNGNPGGSGGGGAGYTGNTSLGGTGEPGQGTNGGTGSAVGTGGQCGGGGGGASSSGNPGGGGSTDGHGGAGITTSITGSNLTLAGGGGGGNYVSGRTSTSGGAGGGGAGGYGASSAGTSAIVNTGGGGGGAGGDLNNNAGGNGGSGIVIIRYQV